MKKETTDSSLRNESLEWDALKWWSKEPIKKQDEFAEKYFQKEKGAYLEDNEVQYIYQQETNPKAIIGSGMEVVAVSLNGTDTIHLREEGSLRVMAELPNDKQGSEDAKLICEAVNNYQSLRDSNAELLEALEWLTDNGINIAEYKIAYQVSQNYPVTDTVKVKSEKWGKILLVINKAKSIK